MLYSESACIYALDTISEKDFSNQFNRDLFLLIQAIFTQGIRPTPAELIKEGMKLGFVRGKTEVDKIRQAAEHFIDDENIGYWTSKVKEASKGRAMQELLKRYHRELSKPSVDISDLIRNASGEVFSLAMDIEQQRTLTGKDLAKEGRELIRKRVEAYRKARDDEKFPGEVPLEGVPTGFPTIDRLSLGYKPGDLILLAAQTGHGKTAFAINTARAICIEAQRRLYYLNTEMSRQQILYRWGAVLSGESMQRLRAGSLNDEQAEDVINSYDLLEQSDFYVDTVASPTPSRVDILTRKNKMQHGIEIMVLDYVGRMEKIERGKEEWQVLEQIVKSMKELAQNQDIAVMVLAQLNEDGSLQGAKRMRNECDMIFKLLPMPREETRREIESKASQKYEEFNYALFVDKARDFEGGRYIPIIFNMEKQQIREAKAIGGNKTEKEKTTDPWLEIGREVKR